MKTIIIGMGEIGKSVHSVLKDSYEVYTRGSRENIGESIGTVEIMHICFPYSDKFIDAVKEYQEKYKPNYIVIHSTVPVGTTEKLDAIHSPCVGIHPHLGESLKTFKKFLGGPKASEVAQYFRRAGVKVYLTDKARTTELMKICSTSFYGVCIEWVKEVKRLCDDNEVPFEFWTIWTDNYNEGYNKLGYPEFTRPNLIPMTTKIGGHCVLPNLKFLDSDFSATIAERQPEE